MADDKKNEEAQGEGKSNKMMIIIIAVAAIVILGGGGAAAVMLMGGEDAPPPTAAEQEAATAAAPAKEASYLVNMDSFVCNLADPKGDRFMKATLRIVVSDESLTERVRTDDLFRTRLRDKALSVLSSKRFQDINNPLGKESLRREMVREFDQIFPAGTVKEVLFVEFVIQ